MTIPDGSSSIFAFLSFNSNLKFFNISIKNNFDSRIEKLFPTQTRGPAENGIQEKEEVLESSHLSGLNSFGFSKIVGS
jgi:hypothetical protein